ncbi:hypothetical protein GLOTRDRAFT_127356 [Gloeophyllum trabeum ATCC 11539]|uniref:Pentatricopeptide repeat-containing protein-mitochondrial domain-containing protein n=1 Tax=Gloeophyllum trabeum (strain ATCC 11539 / FP-39264 / Madison 617) TaxID=670483 RepID=S7QC90_GLOTA|nr:uncharacterized protein GLOTRDRAFT_127356 [Gloeophyllum trabeum ATCC 11539]EPQ56972.1 hypothetical protein GLOTRDRAFT_127356 [Gloeophyllum trabeum ATCC 11539]
MSRFADEGRAANAFRLCGDMKERGVMPNLQTYELLLRSLVNEAWVVEAFAVFEDMLALGIRPSVDTYNTLMRINRLEDPLVSLHILDMLKDAGLAPDTETYGILIDRYLTANNIEMCLELYAQAEAQGVPLNVAIEEKLIRVAADLGFPRLACQLAEQFEARSVRSLDIVTWMKCLTSSSGQLYVDGVAQCWERVVDRLNVLPDEGLCVEVLHTAGRSHLPELAASVIRTLKSLGATLREYHFAPLVEALCGAQRIKEAVLTIELMRENNVEPTLQTIDPLSQWARGTLDGIDVMWTALDELHEEGKTVDVMVVNALIKAAVELGELQRAVGVFQAMPSLGIKPDRTTFEELLAGCIVLRHRELGDRLLAQMKELHIKPKARTYTRLIELCLTQETYEDAFFYLEEMKAQGIKPGVEVYNAIVRKCVENNDSRYKIALEEMKECGYEVSRQLQRFISSGGQVHEGQRARTHLENEWLALLAKRKEAEAIAAAQVETDELLRQVVPPLEEEQSSTSQTEAQKPAASRVEPEQSAGPQSEPLKAAS